MGNKLTEMHSEQERLKNIIKIGFENQSNFARALGINPQELTNYFGGRRAFSEALRGKLESVGVSYEYFKSGVGSPCNSTEAGQALLQKFGAIAAPASANTSAGYATHQQAHKWALVREWLTETGTMAEWYFILQQAIPGVPLDYVLSLEGLAPKEEHSEFEFLICDFVRERGIDPDWIVTPRLLDQFSEGEAGFALKARLMARYAPKSGTAPESSDPLRYSEPELAHQDQ